MIESFLLHFKKRKTIYITIIIIGVLLGIAYFFFLDLSFLFSDNLMPSRTSSSISEETIQKIEKELQGLKTELQHVFYKSLKEYKKTPNKGAPGKKNPFEYNRPVFE